MKRCIKMYEDKYKNLHVTGLEDLHNFLNLIAEYDYKFKHLEKIFHSSNNTINLKSEKF